MSKSVGRTAKVHSRWDRFTQNFKKILKNNDGHAIYGGQTGIRTLETVSRLHTFQACAFDHSATCPLGVVYETGARFSRARSRFPTSWSKKFDPQLKWVRRAQSVQLTGPLDYESKYRAAQTEFLSHWRIAPHRFGGSVQSVLSAHN